MNGTSITKRAKRGIANGDSKKAAYRWAKFTAKYDYKLIMQRKRGKS